MLLPSLYPPWHARARIACAPRVAVAASARLPPRRAYCHPARPARTGPALATPGRTPTPPRLRPFPLYLAPPPAAVCQPALRRPVSPAHTRRPRPAPPPPREPTPPTPALAAALPAAPRAPCRSSPSSHCPATTPGSGARSAPAPVNPHGLLGHLQVGPAPDIDCCITPVEQTPQRRRARTHVGDQRPHYVEVVQQHQQRHLMGGEEAQEVTAQARQRCEAEYCSVVVVFDTVAVAGGGGGVLAVDTTVTVACGGGIPTVDTTVTVASVGSGNVTNQEDSVVGFFFFWVEAVGRSRAGQDAMYEEEPFCRTIVRQALWPSND
nr:proteoglycan 4-like [Aegilops tauschii subsp. strangulata]